MLRIPSAIRYANDRELRARLYDRLFFGTMPSLHIANSNATRETLLMSAPWIPPERVTVIYNGVDPRPLDEAVPIDLKLPADAIKLGFVGRLEARKGIIDLANAWRFIAQWLPKAHLVITGTGAEEADARRILGDSSRVHWLGYRRDVPSILKSLDVLVMPSHWEGFGFVAAEALLAGTPVVASRASSLPELMINGVHGRLVPPGEPLMLAKEIVAFVNNPAGMKRMAAAGRVRILTEFSPGVMVERYERALSQLVQR
jgi:glycosyltransferase involved in cell wall biosynthesis